MSKTKNLLARTALSSSAVSLALGFALAASPAAAQTPGSQENPVSTTPTGDAQAQAAPQTAEIVVTGSRIARRDLDTAAPLAVISATEFKQSGAVNVEQVLNTLPQVVPGATAFSNNPGGGVATLNLRNLGTARTLVLVNGRRYMFFDTSQVVDLNTIPSFLISGVDVVTGGASAVYGSDAITGVVNFRLRTDVQGFEAGAQYNLTEGGDGGRFDAHIAMGTAFADGKGHITTYAEYYKRKPIFQGQRDFAVAALGDNATATGFVPGGSGSTPSGRFAALGGFGTGTIFSSSAIIPVAGGNARKYISSGPGNDTYNYAPSNYLMVPQERWLIGGYGEYEVNEHITAYSEVSFVNNRVDASLAATPFTGNYLFNLTAAQAYLSPADYAALQTVSARQVAAGYKFTSASQTTYTVAPGQVGLSLARRAIEVGLRQQHDDRNAYRVLAGVKGDIISNWNYDAYYTYARTRNASVQTGSLSQSSVQGALLDGSCDLFGPGAITQACANKISIRAQNSDISVLQVANASVTGKLFNFGMGADDVAVVIGGEWRSVHSQFIPDTSLQSGDVVGFSAAQSTAGGYSVKEAFGEIAVPIVANAPFIQRLELDARGRYSDYSLGAVGGVVTYAFEAQYAPVKDIMFRGQYSKAVRAPNVGELFGGKADDSAQASDPCAVDGAQNNANLNALCIATGVPAALVGNSLVAPNAQTNGVQAGNPNLKEERSTSYTYGVVVRPRFLPRFNFTADYFNIKIKGAVGLAGGGAANALKDCYSGTDPNSAVCQLIHRNPETGEIDGSTGANGVRYIVDETNANAGFLATSGIDFAGDYTLPLDFGIGTSQSKLNFYSLTTYTKKLDVQPLAGFDTVHCAGHVGLSCKALSTSATGEPTPKWKTSARVSFINGPVTATFKWTRIGKVTDDDPDTVYTTEKVKAYNLFDLSGSIDITDQYSLSFGVNNLLNKNPPIFGDNQSQSNTYPSSYDVIGRDFYVSANFRF